MAVDLIALINVFFILLCIIYTDIAAGTKPLPGPLIVASKGKVWPRPVHQTYAGGYFQFDPDVFQFKISQSGFNCSLLVDSLDRYKKIIQEEHRNHVAGKVEAKNTSEYLNTLTVTLLQPCYDDEYPSLNSNESYALSVTETNSELQSSSIWGIMRGLETFSQLIYSENVNETYELRINATNIIDNPRFRHRGLLVDTARHYIPITNIYEIIDGLSYNKMNVFHWHIVDDQSFPYVSRKFPELSKKGAYTQRHLYTIEDVQKVIEYARLRGVRIVPEFDTPGHTRSWGLSHPELICQNKGTYGPMDPTQNSTYDFLNDFLAELRQVFKDDYIHLGGDEVDYSCWKYNETISEFMASQGLNDTSDYINFYGQRVINTATRLNFSTIVWEEMFFDGVKLSSEAVVQIWRDWSGQHWVDHIRTITNSGIKTILSACWYLDAIQKTWQDYYNCDPMDFSGTDEQMKLVMGGEACMWGENINGFSVVPRIFPRASAVAEKLWSERNSNKNLEEEAQRLEEHACRMNRRDIFAEPPNGPGYCD